MMCPFCGKVCAPTARMCPNCGHEFRSDSKDGELSGCGRAIVLVFCFILMIYAFYMIFLR